MSGINNKIGVGPLLIILSLIMVSSSISVSAQITDPQEMRWRIFEYFERVLDAYNSGANISEPVSLLNEAIDAYTMYSQGYNVDDLNRFNEALSRIDELLPMLLDEARYASLLQNIIILASIIITGLAIFLGYRYLPRAIFGLWVRLRGRYRVIVRRERSANKSMITNEEVWAVILAIMVVASVFAVSQAYLAGRVVEPFSELGLLGRYMKIGDYPRELVVGDNATFYIYVGNHMGRPMYYIVQVKLGDNATDIDPSPLEPIYVYERVLLHNETWIFRVDLPVERPGPNQRIIVELWIYNETINDIQYHGRWNQLWINVTAI